MSTLDIRNQPKEKEITEIQFDDSSDRLIQDDHALNFDQGGYKNVVICAYEDLDNFIAACKKAKELWAK